MPPRKGEQVSYQGATAEVINVMGEEPNQIFTLRLTDGNERVATLNEINQRGGLQGSNVFAGSPSSMQGNDRDVRFELPNANQSNDVGTRAEPPVEPPLEGGEPTPPWGIDEGGEKPPEAILDGANDAGPGTGDTGAGLKADGKDVDSPRRRLLGTEEIVTYIEPVTRRVVDKNGRNIEIGTTVSVKARIIGFKSGGKDEAGNKGGLKAEVIYPPYRIGSTVPIWSAERNRLEIPNQDNPDEAGGTPYEDAIFSYKDGKVVDANGTEAKRPELQKQEKLLIDVRHIERF